MLLATCLAKGSSQHGPGVVLLTIQSHARHGGCLSCCYQKMLINRSCCYVDCMYSSVLRGVEGEDCHVDRCRVVLKHFNLVNLQIVSSLCNKACLEQSIITSVNSTNSTNQFINQ